MPGVVLVTGVMASGKSTVAQALAERLPRAAHVRGDLFRRMIVSPRIGLWLDTSELSVGETVELSVGETVEAIPAGIVSGRERATVA